MVTAFRHTIAARDAWLVLGLAALWLCLHSSPYYPFTLSREFGLLGVDGLSLRHLTYATALVVSFGVLFLLGGRGRWLDRHLRLLAVVAGALGLAGGVAMALDAGAGQGFATFDGACAVLVGASVTFLVVALLAIVSSYVPDRAALVLTLSYCVYSVVWIALESLASRAGVVVFCIAPAVSALCLTLAFPKEGVFAIPSASRGSVRETFFVPLFVLGCVFVYFGVVIVRVFTAMGAGAALAGQLDFLPYLITAVAGLVLSAAMFLAFARFGYSPTTALGSFVVLSLVYLTALLIVMVMQGGAADMPGKRIMVAAEHCFELLLAIAFASNIYLRKLPPCRLLPLFGIVVLVLPQIVSLDLLHQTGLLHTLVGVDLIMPISAAGVLAIVIAVIAMLVRAVVQATHAAALRNEDWQRDLVERAFSGMDVTPRELDVALLTYRGLSAKKIAEELLVSESTVKTHQQHAYRKLGVHSKQDLIARIDACKGL